MKRVQLSDQVERGVEVNMSPLIDCVFLLLIFFIVTTVFVEETGVDIQKPQAASSQQMEKNSIMIAITAQGEIVFGGRSIPLQSVRGLVKRQLTDPNTPVLLLADDAVPTGVLVQVLDECKLAGAERVSVAAEQP
ncbi:MAG: biopolymer transporter ExbD [Kiritimatiellae bacterium]|jgi:biopolymer transport protein ExbD|nr:biopolymer transporter ExbD [Kiritimatiellia bacterium]